MASIDLVDETFISADPGEIATLVHTPRLWAEWWPDLHLAVFMDRGEKGIRWSVTGTYVGSTEIWIEPFLDGAIVHYYLRLDPSNGGPLGARRAAEMREARARGWKRIIWAVKDELEEGRGPGEPARAGQ